VLAAATLAAGAGCAVDESKEVAIYREVLDDGVGKVEPYRPGRPLSLREALLLANQHSERLSIAGEDYVQALIEKDRVASNFFPTISLAPSYSESELSNDAGARRLTGGQTGDPIELQNRRVFSTGSGNLDVPVAGNWNVFRGFRDWASLGRARADIGRFRALLRDLKATVMLDVATAYYQVLRSEATVRVLENSSSLQDARVSEIEARDRVGSARKLDVAQARAQAANTRAQLVAARADVRNARTLLAFLTNAPVSESSLVDRLDVPEAAVDIGESLAQAELSREDIAAARQATLAAAENVQNAVGEYYPSVGINFNYYLSRDSTPEDSLWNGLIFVNLPLFTAGRIHADVRTALSQLRQAKAQEQLTRRQVEQQVREAAANLEASKGRLAELRIAVQAAQQALDVAEGNYQAGTGIYLERLVAQDQLLNAQLQYATENYTLKLNYLNLLRQTGELRRPPAEGQPATQPGLLSATQPSATGPATP
jgi:outer membrane protein TolC